MKSKEELKAAILGANDRPLQKVYVPEWGEDVWIRVMSSKERDTYEVSLLQFGKNGSARVGRNAMNARALLVSYCLVNEAGERLFTVEEADQLGERNSVVLNRLYDMAKGTNAISEDDIAELEKNYVSSLSDASTST